MVKVCQNCEFFIDYGDGEWKGEDTGGCCRHAPIPVVYVEPKPEYCPETGLPYVPQGEPVLPPTVYALGYCGEHILKEAKP